MKEQIGSLTLIEHKALEKLNTNRLLNYKKSVLAQKSALYNRNKEALNLNHPFDIEKYVDSDFHEGETYILRKPLSKVIDDARDYKFLCRYHNDIKEILATRENVEKH